MSEAANPAPNVPLAAVTVTLQDPIEREGGPVSKLTLRKPRAGELRGMKLSELVTADIGAVIDLLPRISDPFITQQEAAGLSSEDIAEIAGTIVGFFLNQAQRAAVQQMSMH